MKLTIRLYPGADDDLIAWLNSLDFQKGEAIKATLRRGLGQSATTNPATLDAGTLLADIRQVIESSLAGLTLNPSIGNVPEQPDQAEERLARLDRDLLGDHW